MAQEEIRKGPWTEQEDGQLVLFVNVYGDRRWDFIAKVSGLGGGRQIKQVMRILGMAWQFQGAKFNHVLCCRFEKNRQELQVALG